MSDETTPDVPEDEKETVVEEKQEEKKDEGLEVLKRSLEHAKRERNEVKAELAKLRQAQKDAERKDLEKKSEFKALYEKALADLEALKNEKSEFENKIRQRDAEGFASSIAMKGTSDVKRNSLLKEQVMRYVVHTDDGPLLQMSGIVVDEKTLLDHLKGEYPFLFDGLKASGSGALGGGGCAAVSKRWEEHSSEELVKLKKANYDLFTKLKEDYEKRKKEM